MSNNNLIEPNNYHNDEQYGSEICDSIPMGSKVFNDEYARLFKYNDGVDDTISINDIWMNLNNYISEHSIGYYYDIEIYGKEPDKSKLGLKRIQKTINQEAIDIIKNNHGMRDTRDSIAYEVLFADHNNVNDDGYNIHILQFLIDNDIKITKNLKKHLIKCGVDWRRFRNVNIYKP